MKIIRKSIKAIFIIIALIGLFSSFFGNIVYGQSEIDFKTTDSFEIPNTNGSINFVVNGTCEKANLENNKWNFISLKLNNAQNEEKLSFKVSVRECNVTITSYRFYNRSIGRDTVKRARLSYDLVGAGIQSFDLGLDPDRGDWGVRFNGVYVAENRGWSLSSDGILTVTGVTGNIILSYYGIPDSNFNQSFINQHSVVIIVIFITVMTITFSIAIKTRKKGADLRVLSQVFT